MVPHVDRRQLLRATSVGAASVLTDESLPGLIDALVLDVGTDEWPMFHHNATASGYAPGKSGPDSSRVSEQWSAGISPSTSVYADGRLYVTKDGTAYAYDLQTGDGIWSTKYAKGNSGRPAAPAVGDEILYAPAEEGVFGLDMSSGDTEWSFEYVNQREGLTLYNGDIFTGSTNGKLKQIDGSDGTLIKTYDIADGVPQLISTPCINDGKLFALWNGFGDPATLHSFNISTGELLWKSSELSYTYAVSAPAFRDGDIYVHAGSGIYEIDSDTGTSNWSMELDNESSNSSPAVTDDRVYINTGTELIAFERQSGEQVWSGSLAESGSSNEDLCSSAVVAGDIVYVGSKEGSFYAFEASSGEEIWSFETSSNVASSVHNGTVFVSGDSLYALTNEPNQPPIAEFVSNPSDPITDEPVQLDATSSQDDNGIESYQWDISDATQQLTGSEVTHTFTQPGEYAVTLTITDVGGLTDSTSEVIEVVRPAQIPTASFEFTPQSPQRGEIITFDGSGSNSPDGVITEYRWEINGEEKYGEQITHTFETSGEYSITLEVTDDTDLSDSITQVVEIEDEQLSVTVTGDQTEVTVGGTAIINISLVNFLTNGALTAQLVLQTPSGVSVSSVSGAEEGSGQFTAVTELNQGSETNMLIQIQVNEAGEFPVTGRVIYVTEDGSESEQQLDTVTISTIEGESGSQSDGSESTDGSTDKTGDDVTAADRSTNDGGNDGFGPGLGIGSTLTAIGGLGYLLKRRLTEEDNEP